MKNIFSKSLLFSLLLFSCNQQDIKIKKDNSPKVAYTALEKEEKLSQAIKQIVVLTNTNNSGRLMSGLSNMKHDSILKVIQSDSLNYSYTLPVEEKQKSIHSRTS